MDRAAILGVPIDLLSPAQAVLVLRRMLEEPRAHHVMTPNNEMLVQASKDARFREILRASSLNLPDSTGVVWASRVLGARPEGRVTGVDTVMSLCDALDESHPVFLLGGAEGVAGKAADVLTGRNPRLRIAGTYAGSPRFEDATETLRRVREAEPHLLLVAFGSPAQDLWIAQHLPSLPSVRVAMGVGGTFDFLAGVQRRAPAFLRTAGLEWAWRFLLDPWRARRMWQAVVVFPLLVLRYGRDVPTRA